MHHLKWIHTEYLTAGVGYQWSSEQAGPSEQYCGRILHGLELLRTVAALSDASSGTRTVQHSLPTNSVNLPGYVASSLGTFPTASLRRLLLSQNSQSLTVPLSPFGLPPWLASVTGLTLRLSPYEREGEG